MISVIKHIDTDAKQSHRKDNTFFAKPQIQGTFEKYILCYLLFLAAVTILFS